MKTPRKHLIAVITVAIVAAAGSVGYACFMRSPLPVQVWLDHINVDIVDQVAVKTYNCTFRNPNRRAVVGGTCYMELEPGAQVDDMSVLVDGKEMKAEILDVNKAKQIFADIVKNGGSPALLEYFGSQLIQTQVPRIRPNGTVTVKLTYTTILKKKGDLFRLQMLNTNPKASMQPLKSASVTVNLRSKEPIKNIYSPTHKIKIVEKKDWDVAVEWSQNNYMPKHPFVLYYQVADDQVGASVVAHRDAHEDGAFMLMLSPTIGNGAGKVTDAQILPKDVVFCVDTSGSMLQGGKMEQARAALKYCVEALRPGDRFNIVDFSTVARSFNEGGLVELNEASRARALRYIAKLAARGGTAIQESLELSLKQLGESDRLKMILFATDGLPTIGERNPVAILKNMSKLNTQDVRVFVFGEGFDVNTRLLDFLAINNRGEADYILPEEDITKKISQFFDRVGSPIMTDLELDFGNLEVDDVYPRKIADIFKGEQVIVVGRYKGNGTNTIKLTGSVKGKKQTFEFQLDFPKDSSDDRSAFVPRLWAGRKVDFLLEEIRKSAQPPKELVDEVALLAKRYGIVTPYTSFLMAEDVVTEGAATFANRLRRRAYRSNFALDAPSAATPASRQSAVREAKELAQSKRDSGKSGGAAAFDDKADAYAKKLGRGDTALSAIRYIGTKTFYKSGQSWYESVYDAVKDKNAKFKTVEVGSEEYLKLLMQERGIAKYLALGQVVMKIKGTWYRFEKRKS